MITFVNRNGIDYADETGEFVDNCKHCKKAYIKYYKRGVRRTVNCSRACAMSGRTYIRAHRDPNTITDNNKNVRHPRKCLYCDQIFYARKQYGALHKYCSKACANKSRTKPLVYCFCVSCKKKFSVKKTRNEEYPKTCSKKCLSDLSRKYMLGFHAQIRKNNVIVPSEITPIRTKINIASITFTSTVLIFYGILKYWNIL